MKKIIFIRTIFSFFSLCSKNEKIEKWHTYRGPCTLRPLNLIFHFPNKNGKRKYKYPYHICIF